MKMITRTNINNSNMSRNSSIHSGEFSRLMTYTWSFSFEGFNKSKSTIGSISYCSRDFR